MTAMPEQESPVLPDALLLERLVQRDSTALIELERRHHGSLYAQVYGMLVDASVAERVVRETFAHLWYAAARFVGTRSASSWLRETARELARAERALRDRMCTTSDWRKDEEDSGVLSSDAVAGAARRASARAERSRVGYSEGESSGSEGPPRDACAW